MKRFSTIETVAEVESYPDSPFWLNVKKSKDCWIWTDRKDKAGYGILSDNSRSHRVAYQIAYGAIPKGLYVCHHCDNPTCVKPSHLFLGTAKDNVQDSIEKGRGGNHGAKLNKKQVKEIREKYANCKCRYKDLADEYRVCKSTIGGIVRKDTWLTEAKLIGVNK